MELLERRALFCWEIGDGHGHVAPYAALLDGLRERGWSVFVALSNTAVAPRWARESGALLQAPVCRQVFAGIPELSFSYAEMLLSFGFAHAETLAGMVAAWRGIISLVEPRLVISSSAPSAMVAARIDGIPSVRIGVGFDCPPPGARTPLMRPWVAGIDDRLESSEAVCRKTINEVLRQNAAPPVETVSEALLAGEILLCTYPELDYFGQRDVRYFGVLPGERDDRPSSDETVDVLAYVRLQYQHTESLLSALHALGLSAMVHCPDISAAGRAKWQRDRVVVTPEPLNLGTWIPRCRVVASYGGHGLTASALLAGKPLLLLPNHLEQLTTAMNVVKIGAALVAGAEDRHPKLKAMLRSLLDEPRFGEAAAAFALRHCVKSMQEQLADAIAVCERVAAG